MDSGGSRGVAYSSPLKTFFRKHYCYNCDTPLKMSSRDSTDEFQTEFDVVEYAIFYCPRCGACIEDSMQISYEDVALLAIKVEKYFKKKMGKDILITRHLYIPHNYADIIYNGERGSMYLKIQGDVREELTYDVKIKNDEFVVKKRELIKFIKKHLR